MLTVLGESDVDVLPRFSSSGNPLGTIASRRESRLASGDGMGGRDWRPLLCLHAMQSWGGGGRPIAASQPAATLRGGVPARRSAASQG